MKKRIAKLVGPRKFEIVEEEIAPLEEHHILVRTISSGFCHSDLAEYQGIRAQKHLGDGSSIMDTDLTFPRGIGHEPVGVVEDVGKAVTRFKEGDIVGGGAGSAFATHVLLNGVTGTVAIVPPDTKEVKHCLAEPLGCCSNIVRAATPELGDYVAVIGCGMMGLLCISGIAHSGAFEVIAIDLLDSRLELAEKYGATVTLNPSKTDTGEEIKEITGGRGVDVVVEITGRMAGFTLACEIVKGNKRAFSTLKGTQGRGKILIPSLYAKPETIDAGYNLMFKSPIIHSTHPWYSMNFQEDLERGVESYRRGIFPISFR